MAGPRKRVRRPRAAGPTAGDRAVGFFPDALVHSKGEWAGQPFVLLPWQAAVVRQLFGTLRADGRRQYRRCYVEVPRKNGKTSWVAGLGLYLLLADGEPGAEIYSAAADRDQAGIMFDQAKAMVEANPALKAHVAIYRRELVVPSTGSRYRVLSADAPGKHGLNAHGILFDELHAQPNRELFDTLWTSTGARRQPLSIAITTAGYDRTSICWEQHELAVQVRDGVRADPTFLPVLYGADPDDDWTAPATWAKANPSLGTTVREDYLAAECARAQASPAYENTFKRLHLCLWTQQQSRWMPLDPWRACDAIVPDDELAGVPCYAGLDLGVTQDFSALVLVFLLPDGRVATRARFWLPESALEAHPLRPYALWRREGWLTVNQGNATELDLVEAETLAWCQEYGVRELAYDKRFALQLSQRLQTQGVTVIDTPQGVQLNEALGKLLELVLTGKLAHGGDPILTWMAGNVVVRTTTDGRIRPDKDAAKEKIDGIVALAMAMDRAIRHAAPEASAYADHGLLTV